MAILPIIEAPHPLLSKAARVVADHEFTDDLRRLLTDMAETMYAAPGVGLAGPQVSDSRRILVADPGNQEDEHGIKRPNLFAMINPEIVDRSPAQTVYEESCLSVPGFYIDIKRPQRIQVRWRDGHGEIEEAWFDGFSATVIQHEMDHLDGITLLDRASRFRRSRYVTRQKKRIARQASK